MNFKNRVFGCAVVRAINANYNADFSHQPRTLPDGKVYATDKAFKYLVKNYIKDLYPTEKVFYFKSQKEDFNPRSLEETYDFQFPESTKKSKTEFAQDLLRCIDIRCFGATFAMKAKDGNNVAISIHGPVQVNHGINIWSENNIFSEQIMSPFADKEGAEMTTLGRQSKLQEGHYLHHFSVNPKNLEEIVKLAGEGSQDLIGDDISKLKTAFRLGATYFDSAAKAGIDNEVLLWIQLKPESKKVLPSFSNLIKMVKEDNKAVFDFSKVKSLVEDNQDDIHAVEIYSLKNSVVIKNKPETAKSFDIISGKKI
ncbi:CRISPR-associated protein Csh2 [Catalinimonas alkaloidigena]|uniref:type I CRISPR-associated protein Cas7 n=1 Tax=Catalinimonas alkaloidigena TaxID=1075417 RepID=UPI002404FEB3|nr:type I CRISPR-associated protein Cas7 [Catalinimonas alkaloidigena]MDF9796277.1 CRISPR-associated protein Csh2 [Catalinimonas alkaloidigena]